MSHPEPHPARASDHAHHHHHPQQFFERTQAGEKPEVIDVHTPVEHREVHASLARNMPLDQLDAQQLAAEQGVTDTCGMGMLLARMPWNQVR